MRISEIFADKQKNGQQPVLSFEIYPPKHNAALEDIDETLRILASLNPDYISVTFGAGGSSNNNKTIALANKIKSEYGIEPLVHLICLSYSESEIDDFLTELHANNLENILALRGDLSPNAPSKNDFLHASDLIAYIKSQTDDFCIASACYPEKHPQSSSMDADLDAMKKKATAGTSFFVSQLFFENDYFSYFQNRSKQLGIMRPISAGIMPVINKNQIEKMITLCGASLPPRFRNIIDRYGENREALFDAGLAYAVSQIIDLAACGVDGIHLYTMNNPKVAERIVNSIKSIVRP